jgi:hypothetical protein
MKNISNKQNTGNKQNKSKAYNSKKNYIALSNTRSEIVEDDDTWTPSLVG